MSYSLPTTRIFQLTRQITSAATRRPSACLVGGNAKIFRYANSDEKLQILLGIYNSYGTLVDGEWQTCYSWPSKPTGSTIDPSYTKVFIDNALLRYFNSTDNTMTKTAANQIRHPSLRFAAHGNNSHSPEFLDRGVKVGDIVSIVAEYSSITYRLYTYVTGFVGETVAASIEAAYASYENQATVSADADVVADAANSGDADITALTNSYSGYIDGDVSETYTVEVIRGSTGGDLTTALLRISSASGHDDVAEQIPAASGYYTDIGTRGLSAQFDDNGGDLIVGDKWVITVNEAWTATEPTSGGTYIGTKDRTYVIEVVTGGISDAEESDDPWITARATDGSDFSGPTRVPTAADTAVPVGAYGVTVSFDTAKLRKGDRFYIQATAETEGDYKTLKLAHSLDDALPLNSNAVDMEVSLYIKKNVELTEKSITSDGDYYWTQNDDNICVLAGAHAYDSTWTDNGELQALPIITDYNTSSANKLYVEYKAWLADDLSVNSISDISELDDALPGPIIPANPLKYGLSLALENNNGYPVYYIKVADPSSLSSWSDALETLENKSYIYNLVPLTYNSEVVALFKAHVDAQSGPEQKRYRAVVMGVEPVRTKVIASAATSIDGNIVMATTKDNPNASGTQYTLLVIGSHNFDLLAAGVRPNDIVRIRYGTDAWGTESYETHVIEDVISEDTLLLATGTEAAEEVDIKIEIWRSLTKTEQAEENAAIAAAYDDWRVVAILADQVGVSGVALDNYFMACSVAALIGGVFQHQGLTNYQVSGYTKISDVGTFTETQRNIMAESGIWLVVADDSGRVYTRHALTTAQGTVLAEREEMLRRNFDMICATFDAGWAPQIGVSNATVEKLSALRVQFESTKEALRTVITPDLGPYLVDATITDLRISPVFKDRVILNATLDLPAPFNNLDAYFLV